MAWAVFAGMLFAAFWAARMWMVFCASGPFCSLLLYGLPVRECILGLFVPPWAIGGRVIPFFFSF